jgi:hypothetical protein
MIKLATFTKELIGKTIYWNWLFGKVDKRNCFVFVFSTKNKYSLKEKNFQRYAKIYRHVIFICCWKEDFEVFKRILESNKN